VFRSDRFTPSRSFFRTVRRRLEGATTGVDDESDSRYLPPTRLELLPFGLLDCITAAPRGRI
jgi:hypothetical protein